jgi:hypothetical protein
MSPMFGFVADAAEEAKKLGADAVLVESHGSSSEPAAAFTNASIIPIGSGVMVTGSTIIARHHTDRAKSGSDTVARLAEKGIRQSRGIEQQNSRSGKGGSKAVLPGQATDLARRT